jgi:DNA-binding response OmpR family regulator
VRVLVVDDDQVIVRLLELNLELEGHQVVTALDGATALRLARDAAPDAVLLDVMMPELDGYGVCERLRADAATADLPIVFLSARAQSDDVTRGTDAGADAYITKPFDPLELVALLEELVGRRRTGTDAADA